MASSSNLGFASLRSVFGKKAACALMNKFTMNWAANTLSVPALSRLVVLAQLDARTVSDMKTAACKHGSDVSPIFASTVLGGNHGSRTDT